VHFFKKEKCSFLWNLLNKRAGLWRFLILLKIVSNDLSDSMNELLSYATSNVEQEFVKYFQSQNSVLYEFEIEEVPVGCIGVELISPNRCEIKHIAVSPLNRENGIASKMINHIIEIHSITFILAETDKEAVEFYEKYGFKVTSLGEKYPGIERFLCEMYL
jgi:ribosomal protein S18 acetylase RimI-like enzyme